MDRSSRNPTSPRVVKLHRKNSVYSDKACLCDGAPELVGVMARKQPSWHLSTATSFLCGWGSLAALLCLSGGGGVSIFAVACSRY